MRWLRRAAAVLVVLVLVALVALVGVRLLADRHRSGQADALPVGTSTVHLSTASGQRSSLVHVPAGLTGPAPLVLVLHGGFGSGAQAQRSYGWDAVTDREGFVVAHPDGLGRAWSSGGGCCGAAARDGVDDVAFLVALVADLGARTSVDPDRVYAAGMSNGAMMALRLACSTDTFAAVGAVAGTIAADTACTPPGRPSVALVNGTADTRVLYAGGTSTVGSATIRATPAPDVAALWREVDRCPDPTTTAEGVVVTAAARCPDGRGVELVTVQGYGHQWPSPRGSQTPCGEPVYTGWDATEHLWEFFAAHPRG